MLDTQAKTYTYKMFKYLCWMAVEFFHCHMKLNRAKMQNGRLEMVQIQPMVLNTAGIASQGLRWAHFQQRMKHLVSNCVRYRRQLTSMRLESVEVRNWASNPPFYASFGKINRKAALLKFAWHKKVLKTVFLTLSRQLSSLHSIRSLINWHFRK